MKIANMINTIKKILDQYKDTQPNMASESCRVQLSKQIANEIMGQYANNPCLLYTSPRPRDRG